MEPLTPFPPRPAASLHPASYLLLAWFTCREKGRLTAKLVLTQVA
ncbi:MAG TPA: hypothetical protein VKP04_08260 [Ktedonobacteraceae bacterium]|nr:hypothetical protein [Ktedonobacteraceae bacterium]